MKKYYSLILVLVSNTLTALIFSMPAEVTIKESKTPILKNGFMRFNLSGKLFFPLGKTNTVVPISIFDSKGQLLIKKGLLFKAKINSYEENQSFDFETDEDRRNIYIVDIPIDESKKIINLSTTFLHFFPFNRKNQYLKIKRQNYEIKF